jgi:hypothetical protein
LEATAPCGIPCAIQVDDDVHTTVEPKALLEELVCVNLEIATGFALMEATMEEVRVTDQTGHTGQRLEELEKR